MLKQDNETSQDDNPYIGTGVEVVGGLVGAGIGVAVAGPAGALVGGAVAPIVTHTIRKIVEDFRHRALSRREVLRVDTVLAFAATKIEENIANGQQIRQDTFFTEGLDDRSAGEEIMEAVLLTAQREYAEKKLKYYGNLLGNIAFHPEVSGAMANQLIRIAEWLSYRQLALLAFVSLHPTEHGHGFKYKSDINSDPSMLNIVEEIYDLTNQGVLERTMSYDMYLGVSLPQLKIGAFGSMFFELMELKDIDKSDIDEISTYIRFDPDDQN